MKNSLRIHKWTHNEFNIFILGVFDTPSPLSRQPQGSESNKGVFSTLPA